MSASSADPTDPPPGASPRVMRVARVLVRPLERFLRIQSASSVVLLAAAAVALGWANSPWAGSYHALWQTELHLGVGAWSASTSLHFVVNDVLMAVLFFVVGLEIRRELHAGELSDLRRASLPIIAAIGGMLVPALCYLAISPGGDAARGWGVPMATDIAFAVGILALLGPRVPPGLRVLLLGLAIIDDIGAIVVIAIFYSAGIQLAGLGIAVAGIAAIVALQRFGVRSAIAYAIPAAVIWCGVLWAGIHPTLAGVIVGLLTPARAWYGPQRLLDAAHQTLGEIHEHTEAAQPNPPELAGSLSRLGRAQREALSPVERMEVVFHPWVAFGIMPAFALANAGVDLGGIALGAAPGVALGIAAGLVVGKPIGVMLASALAVKLGIAALPGGVTWRGLMVVGTVAGIGFTMAIFIAGLAFEARPDLHGIAKVAVLSASVLAAVLTLIIGRRVLRPPEA